MAISGSYDFVRNAQQIYRAALRKVGIKSPKTGDDTNAMEALNVVVKALQAPGVGVHLWTIIDSEKSFTSEDTSFTPSTDTIALTGAYLTDTNSYEHEVVVISYDKYMHIVDKTRTGRITHIAFNYAHSGGTGTIYVYPTIGSSYYTDTLHYKAVKKLNDFDVTTDDPDFPIYWTNALIWLTAEELTMEYKVTPEIYDRIISKAGREFRRVKGNPQFVDDSFVEPSYDEGYY